MEGRLGQTWGKGSEPPHPLPGHLSPQTSLCSPARKLSEPRTLGICGGFMTLVIDPTPKVGGAAWFVPWQPAPILKALPKGHLLR